MEFRILGQVEVRDGERVLALHGSTERALLAYLLLHANEVVASDRLIDELWGAEPPTTVSTALHVYVSRLRKLLGANGSELLTSKPGYVLRVDPDQVDLLRFERLVEEGRRSHMQGDPTTAARVLREALSLWRGPALTELSAAEWAQAEIARLEELRVAAIEDRVDADLDLGRHTEVVGELQSLVAKHPLRERLRAQLILALYRCGRHGDALQAYAEARRVFAEELGLEPSASLRRLEQAVLAQDPSLELKGVGPGKPPRRRNGRAALGVTAVTVAAAVAVAVLLNRQGGSSAAAAVAALPNSVAAIDTTSNRVVADVAVGGQPAGIAVGAGAVWVGDFDDATVVRIDPAAARVVRSIGVGIKPFTVAADGGTVWAASPRRLVRISSTYNSPSSAARLRQNVPGFNQNAWGFDTVAVVAAGPAGVWVAYGVSAVSEIDPRNGAVRRTVALDAPVVGLAIGKDTVWAMTGGSVRLVAIDGSSASVTDSMPLHAEAYQYEVGREVWHGVAVTDASVWVPAADGVRRIDPLTGSTIANIHTGAGAMGVAAGDGAVWDSNYLAHTVSRIDPKSNAVVATVRLAGYPSGLAISHGRVWVVVS